MPKRSKSKKKSATVTKVTTSIKQESKHNRARSRSRPRSKTPAKKVVVKKEPRKHKQHRKPAIKTDQNSIHIGFKFRFDTLDFTGMSPGDVYYSIDISPMTLGDYRLTTLGSLYSLNKMHKLTLHWNTNKAPNVFGKFLVATLMDPIEATRFTPSGGGQALINELCETYRAKIVDIGKSTSVSIPLSAPSKKVYNDLDADDGSQREQFYGAILIVPMVLFSTEFESSPAQTNLGDLWFSGEVSYSGRDNSQALVGYSATAQSFSGTPQSGTVTTALAPSTTVDKWWSPVMTTLASEASNIILDLSTGGFPTVARSVLQIVWNSLMTFNVSFGGSATARTALSDGEQRLPFLHTDVLNGSSSTAIESSMSSVNNLYYDPDTQFVGTQTCEFSPQIVTTGINSTASGTVIGTASSLDSSVVHEDDVFKTAMATTQPYRVWKNSEIVLALEKEDWKDLPRVVWPTTSNRKRLAAFKDAYFTKYVVPHAARRGRPASIQHGHFSRRVFYHAKAIARGTVGGDFKLDPVYAEGEDAKSRANSIIVVEEPEEKKAPPRAPSVERKVAIEPVSLRTKKPP